MQKLTTDELNRLSTDEFQQIQKHNFVLVLDNVRSLSNVGSVFRTADSFLAEKIYLCGITGTPPNREMEKTALGATQTVDWQHFAHTYEALQALRSQGYIIVCVEQVKNSIFLNDFVFENITKNQQENQQENSDEKPKKYAFVFGNEVFGVAEDVIALSDFCIEIPQFGSKHSLNISVTAGIICWDFVQKTTLLR